MYAELTVEELLNQARRTRNFIVAPGFSNEDLFELSKKISESKKILKETYILDAADEQNYPSFKSIKSPSGGLIFPQSEPIILIIANYYRLSKEDQKIYIGAICKKEEGDYYPHLYLHEESVVIIGIGDEDETPKFSYKFQVRKIVK